MSIADELRGQQYLNGLIMGPKHRQVPLPAYGVTEATPSPDTTLLAFDPGGTTGWFRSTYSADGEIYNPCWGQLEKPKHYVDLTTLLLDTLTENPHLTVVAEDYRPDFARAQNYIALEYIGVMEAFCRTHLISFERQGRDIKTFWTSANLKKTGFWPVGQPHAQDAARHWLAYAGKQNSKLARNILRLLK